MVYIKAALTVILMVIGAGIITCFDGAWDAVGVFIMIFGSSIT